MPLSDKSDTVTTKNATVTTGMWSRRPPKRWLSIACWITGGLSVIFTLSKNVRPLRSIGNSATSATPPRGGLSSKQPKTAIFPFSSSILLYGGVAEVAELAPDRYRATPASCAFLYYLLPALALYFIGVKENSSIVCSMMSKPSTPLIYLVRKSVARAAAR